MIPCRQCANRESSGSRRKRTGSSPRATPRERCDPEIRGYDYQARCTGRQIGHDTPRPPTRRENRRYPLTLLFDAIGESFTQPPAPLSRSSCRQRVTARIQGDNPRPCWLVKQLAQSRDCPLAALQARSRYSRLPCRRHNTERSTTERRRYLCDEFLEGVLLGTVAG
jgi:hypothetical protein